MDDVIIIILTLLLTIFGAINQSKKKKAQQQRQQSEPEAEPDFWKAIMGEDEPEVFSTPGSFHYEEGSERATPAMVRDHFEGESEKQPETYQSRLFFRGEQESQGTFKRTSPAFGGEMPGIDTIEGERIQTTVSQEEVGTGEEERGLLSDFSLRRAVIYSEILKPKYF